MDNIIAILNKESSKLSVNNDISLKVGINNSLNTLPYGDINKILNVSEQFYKERNASTNYRFIFTINALMTNILTDIGFDTNNGSDSLLMFNRSLFMNDGDGNKLFTNITDSINNYLVNNNGWLGYYVPKWYSINNYPEFTYIGDNNRNKFIELKPKLSEFDLTPASDVKNWEIMLTYPYTSDTTHHIVNNGLVIVNVSKATIGAKELTLITIPVKHNLNAGDSVKISGNTYTIIRLGEDNGDNKEYSYVINVPYTVNTITVNDRMFKLYGGKESVYYLRKFKRLTNLNDYEVYPLAFSKNIYNDRVYQCVFNKDINTSGYSDNLGRPLSEVYLTVIKKTNTGFTNTKSGIDIPLLNITDANLSDIHKIHNLPPTYQQTYAISDIPLAETPIFNAETYYGDIVEYNEYNVAEVVLADVMHRFNRTDRDANERPEGYYYKPHTKIQLRYWSTFIEQGDENTDNLPYYAQDLGDGRFLWRDLLEIGDNDGQEEILDYPFLNGSHYRYSNISLNLRRQDPYNEYNLYYGNSPRDVYGGKTDMSNLNIKKGDDGNGCC